MSHVLFSVIAATSLVAAGVPGATRSAQSLPDEHLVVAAAHPSASGHVHPVNRLADAAPDNSWSNQSPEATCKHHGGHWSEHDQKCESSPVVYVIGAATLGGFIYAMTSRNGGGSSGQVPVSN